ncbi:MAG: pirin family protein, partial [Steroidobacteraceae bacterium]
MNSERLESHRAVVGEGFEVRRALPNRHRRTVGAWCFLDHAGPVSYAAGRGVTIGPHPHIGLQTFTWMIEGTILHNDSLGFSQWIHPGQVNLMTAGRGISHAEESPADVSGKFQLTQLWIALPMDEANREPSFHHYPELPLLDRGGFRITVLAGTFAGERAPAEVFSPLVGLDLATAGSARTDIPLDPGFEHGVLTLEGAPVVEREPLAPGTLHYLGSGRASLTIDSAAASRLLLIGGRPFGEEILL